jgi:hypothetical protein
MIKFFNFKVGAGVIAISLGMFCVPQQAYSYNIYRDCPELGGTVFFRWQNSFVEFDVNENDFNAVQRNRMTQAGNQFAFVGGSSIAVNVTSSNFPSYFYGDGRNSIYVNNTAASGNTVARAKYTAMMGFGNDCSNVSAPGFLIEADVWMNGNTNWSTSNQPFLVSGSTNGVHIGRTVMHEVGHSLGLSGRSLTSTGADSGQANSHENALVATMNSIAQFGSILGGNGQQNNLGTFRSKLHADDAAALRLLYPGNGNWYDAAGSRFRSDRDGSLTQNDRVVNNLRIRRGSGYFLPYTIMNLGTTTQDVRIDVWMTRDGLLDGQGTDIQLTNGGAPLFHLYTMNNLGRIPGNPVNEPQSSTREGQIYFVVPNDAATFPNNSNWLIGYQVSQPFLPGGAIESDNDDNWVSLRRPHRVVP